MDSTIMEEYVGIQLSHTNGGAPRKYLGITMCCIQAPRGVGSKVGALVALS